MADCWENLCLEDISQYPWSIPLEIFILVYSFIGLAISCDDYLVKSLETFAARWDIKEDIAGAQFMALGSAAPEIMISIICVCKGNAHAGLGMGAILGSGLIANLLVPAVVIWSCKEDELKLKRRPFFRDILFYAISLSTLIYIVHEPDGSFGYIDAGVLLFLYIIYIMVLHWSRPIRLWWRKRKGKSLVFKESFVRVAKRRQSAPNVIGGLDTSESPTIKTGELSSDHDLTNPLLDPKKRDHKFLGSLNSPTTPEGLESPLSEMDETNIFQVLEEISEEDAESQSILAKVWSIFILPLKTMFKYTCIDCELDGKYEKYYPLTFFSSILWVSFFSFVISAVIASFVARSGVSNDFFGVTLVALSAEIPDTIQSVTVARRGYGSMAVGNFLGSQIINICIGIGLPYFITALAGKPMDVAQGGINVETYTLFGGVLLHASLLLALSWLKPRDKARLNKKKGIVLFFAFLIALSIIAGITFSKKN